MDRVFGLGGTADSFEREYREISNLSVIAYAESQIRGHLERETTSVLPLLTAYHQLQAEALSQAASMAMIDEARKGTP
ncbi:hypothetical protein ACWGJW_14490 [Streptomyces nigrescens]